MLNLSNVEKRRQVLQFIVLLDYSLTYFTFLVHYSPKQKTNEESKDVLNCGLSQPERSYTAKKVLKKKNVSL